MTKTDRNGNKTATATDGLMRYILATVASAAVLIILFIFIFIAGNGAKAVGSIGLWDFITGTDWAPLSDHYGALPLITGTLLVTAGAMLIALPVGICCAVFISEVAGDKLRSILKPVCEIFAGIPSVVYGFIGLVAMVPLLRQTFPDNLLFGSSWLAGSIILGIMALPTVISISEDAIRSVPRAYREASLALGATRWETTVRVVIPAAASGIAAASILGIGRAIGETMAVIMVTGNSAIFPEPIWNIFSLIRTLTSSLALEMPESVAGSVHQSALFLLALVLMIIVLVIDLAARRVAEGMGSTAGKEGFVSRILGQENTDRVTRIGAFILAFLLVWAMVSLFTSPVLSALTAAVMIAAAIVLKTTVRRLGPNIRQTMAHTTMAIVMATVCVLLGLIVGFIVIKGAPAISWEFLTQAPSDGGRSGGIFPAIVGTMELIAGTLVIAVPFGLLTGIYLAEYAGDSKITGIIREAIDILNGTPSIVFGLFGLSVFVIMFGWNYSLIGGCLTLAMMIAPTIIRTTEESIREVPDELIEASMAMGATKWQSICHVVVPAALGGIMTGSILGLGRAAGETAPIMFTAAVAFQTTVKLSLFAPVMALPYHLYYLAAEVPGSGTMQYGTALVLLVIVLLMFGAASFIRRRSNRWKDW
jgi:phosphate transport system permease protein